MTDVPESVPLRTVGEGAFHSDRVDGDPSVDPELDATFVSPSGVTLTMPGFYDGLSYESF